MYKILSETNNQTITYKTNVTNILDSNEIIINSRNPFGSNFLMSNIKSLYFSLESQTDIDANQYLLNKKYCIYIGGCNVYTGIISLSNIFPVSGIPLDLIVYHDVNIVIFDVNIPKEELQNMDFCVVAIKTNDRSNIKLDNQCESLNFISWYPNESENDKNEKRINELRFICGMAGCKRNYLGMSESYLKNISETFTLGNKLKILKINHKKNDILAKDFCDQYNISRALFFLALPEEKNRVNVVIETINLCKSVDNNKMSLNFIGDGVGNIKIFCDEHTDITEDNSDHKHLVLNKTSFGYETTNLNNLKFLNLVGDSKKITLCINNPNKTIEQLDVTYDRYCCDYKLRKNIYDSQKCIIDLEQIDDIIEQNNNITK